MASRWRRWARISFALDLLLGVKVVVAAQDPVGPSIADQGCGSPPNLLSGAADPTPPPTVDERNRAGSMNKTRDDVPADQTGGVDGKLHPGARLLLGRPGRSSTEPLSASA